MCGVLQSAKHISSRHLVVGVHHKRSLYYKVRLLLSVRWQNFEKPVNMLFDEVMNKSIV